MEFDANDDARGGTVEIDPQEFHRELVGFFCFGIIVFELGFGFYKGNVEEGTFYERLERFETYFGH